MTADEFNHLYPIGTPVLAYPGVRPEHPTFYADTDTLATRTRTPAWTLGHGTAVVSVDGYAGGIDLDHIDVIHRAEAYTPPAPYVRNDGVNVCPHTTPVAPGSCEGCWDIAKWDYVDLYAATRGEPGDGA
jgi:hypothetical protein